MHELRQGNCLIGMPREQEIGNGVVFPSGSSGTVGDLTYGTLNPPVTQTVDMPQQAFIDTLKVDG